MVSRVVNNLFRIPDNVDSDEDHFDTSDDKDAPGDYEPYVNKTKQVCFLSCETRSGP